MMGEELLEQLGLWHEEDEFQAGRAICRLCASTI